MAAKKRRKMTLKVLRDRRKRIANKKLKRLRRDHAIIAAHRKEYGLKPISFSAMNEKK